MGALDIGYRPGLKPEDLKSAKLLYLLAAVSPCSTLRAELYGWLVSNRQLHSHNVYFQNASLTIAAFSPQYQLTHRPHAV